MRFVNDIMLIDQSLNRSLIVQRKIRNQNIRVRIKINVILIIRKEGRE